MVELSVPWWSYNRRKATLAVEVANMKLLMILALTLVLVNARRNKRGVDCDINICPFVVRPTCGMNSHAVLQLFINSCEMYGTNCRQDQDFREVPKSWCAGKKIYHKKVGYIQV